MQRSILLISSHTNNICLSEDLFLEIGCILHSWELLKLTSFGFTYTIHKQPLPSLLQLLMEQEKPLLLFHLNNMILTTHIQVLIHGGSLNSIQSMLSEQD